jgi:hypothetical protein
MSNLPCSDSYCPTGGYFEPARRVAVAELLLDEIHPRSRNLNIQNAYHYLEGDANTKPHRGARLHMIPEKTKRSLRRMRGRIAKYRRKRAEALRQLAGRSGTSSTPRSADRTLRHVDAAARRDGTRRLTRQELRVEAELRYATHELGLT